MKQNIMGTPFLQLIRFNFWAFYGGSLSPSQRERTSEMIRSNFSTTPADSSMFEDLTREPRKKPLQIRRVEIE